LRAQVNPFQFFGKSQSYTEIFENFGFGKGLGPGVQAVPHAVLVGQVVGVLGGLHEFVVLVVIISRGVVGDLLDVEGSGGRGKEGGSDAEVVGEAGRGQQIRDPLLVRLLGVDDLSLHLVLDGCELSQIGDIVEVLILLELEEEVAQHHAGLLDQLQLLVGVVAQPGQEGERARDEGGVAAALLCVEFCAVLRGIAVRTLATMLQRP
jgi:hypothetical protein